MGRLTNIFESLLLSEGRKEKARERYPQINDIVFNHYVDADPSGNHKYLDWMLGTTVSDSKNFQSGNGENPALRPDKRPIQYHYDMVKAIQFFHENQQRFHEKDVNKYRTLKLLEDTIEFVKEKIEAKRLEKEAKKNRDIIHDDDKWLVVVPKSHKASCYYGAGTKWCVTSKSTDQHWETYKRNATFFFILDKTKDTKDPLYKVAMRRIGRGNRFELWNAVDTEISHRQEGTKYWSEIPEKIKESIEEYHRKVYGEMNYDLEELTPREQALENLLGDIDFDRMTYEHYGIPMFETSSGEEYAVATDDEAENALWEYNKALIEDLGVENMDPDGDYIFMNDEDGFIDSEVEWSMSDMDEEEAVTRLGYDGDIEELEERIDESDDEDEKDDLRSEIETLKYRAMQEIEDDIRNEWESCLYYGPVECLVRDRGLYSYSDLLDSGLVWVDEDGIADNLTSYGDYEGLAIYDGIENTGEDLEGNQFHIFRIN